MSRAARGTSGRWRWPIQLGVILTVLVLLQWWRAMPLASGAAPPLTGPLVGGGAFDLAAPRDRPLVVYFWASWCPVCRMSNGDIADLAIDHPVITVAMQSGDAAEVMAYLSREGLTFPVISDPDGALSGRWGVPAVPASFVVDPHGQIRFSSVGYTTAVGLRARLWAARVLD
jgi:peroxiredoxin